MIIECAGYSHEFDDKEIDKWADRLSEGRVVGLTATGLARLPKSQTGQNR